MRMALLVGSTLPLAITSTNSRYQWKILLLPKGKKAYLSLSKHRLWTLLWLIAVLVVLKFRVFCCNKQKVLVIWCWGVWILMAILSSLN
uniref:Uncharacterized protein LOC105640940 isoform X4 n=1 Tax=Rhizophora mucronata TaxID=61149 RepID=A0A2P2IYU7_RHIMU